MDEYDFGGFEFDGFNYDESGDSSGAFDITSSNDFNPVDFSEGESASAGSDAQNVDYGWGVSDAGTDVQPDPVGAANNEMESQNTVYNDTPESGSSDYGVVNYPADEQTEVKPGIYDAQSATKEAGVKPSSGTGAGSGASKSSGGSMTPKGSAPAPQTVKTPTKSAPLVLQKESKPAQTYMGQLQSTPKPVATTEPASQSGYLLIGAAVVLILLIKKGSI